MKKAVIFIAATLTASLFLFGCGREQQQMFENLWNSHADGVENLWDSSKYGMENLWDSSTLESLWGSSAYGMESLWIARPYGFNHQQVSVKITPMPEAADSVEEIQDF